MNYKFKDSNGVWQSLSLKGINNFVTGSEIATLEANLKAWLGDMVSVGQSVPAGTCVKLWLDTQNYNAATGKGAILKVKRGNTFIPVTSVGASIYASDIRPLDSDEIEYWLDTSTIDETSGEGAVLKYRTVVNNLVKYIPLSGGSSSGGGLGKLTISNEVGLGTRNVAYGANAVISFSWSSIYDGEATGSGTLQLSVNGTVKLSKEITQGTVSLNIKDFLAFGNNDCILTVIDRYGNKKIKFFSITTVALSMTSKFDSTSIFSGDIAYTYTPIGATSKTIHVEVDGTEITTNENPIVITVSGRQQTYTISALEHGSHTLRVWFTATLDGNTVTSNDLCYDLICTEVGDNTTIISSNYRTLSVNQYTTIAIPYRVYNPSLFTSPVTLKVDGNVIASYEAVGRTQQVWSYRCDNTGSHTFTITSGDTVKSFAITVNAVNVTASAETNDLELYLSSYGRSNREANPDTWSYGNISATFTDFNHTSDCWQTDSDGISVLRVAGDARLSIPLNIFANDFRTTGKTIEIEFATRDVLNYDTTIISCWSGNRGFTVTPQKFTLKSEKSTVETQYKEDEHIRITFVIEKTTEDRLILCYINGIISGSFQYPANDDFSQANAVGISIGSSYCTTDIYCIRSYNNDLTRYQVLDNWIADSQDGALMVDRFQRNNIFNAYGDIVIDNLQNDLPYLILTAEELPQFKGDKKIISGSYTDPENPSNSFTFSGAEANVQGTSSAGYARKNYKIKFKRTGSTWIDNEGNQLTNYQMRENSIPTSTFTFKADVASSEGCNNVELVRLYNDTCPYQTPPQEENSSIRQGIDGFPIVIFWDNGDTVSFLGKYNFNNDKGTSEVYGFATGDESWEVLNNTSNRVLFKSADYSGAGWLDDFEARYPEENTDNTNLSAMASWLVSTDTTAATNNVLENPAIYNGTTYTVDSADYRLAKFKAEFTNYFEKDSAVFYYLFTELFLLVDSRAKNMFPSFFGDDKWCFLPYDFDTAIGINNEGALAFGYELEDIDTVNGANVFNGQNSVLWKNLRSAFYADIKSMYNSLRTATGTPFSYSGIESRFEEHQAKWCEALFNEDSYFKYLQPLFDDNDPQYLSMLQGSKAEQRKWWLYNRFRYMDSKYNTGDALNDYITLRAYAKSNISVTPFADIYATVKYGSYLVQERAGRGTQCPLVCPLNDFNDTEVYIYSASQLSAIGDISPLKVGLANFSMATHLNELKIGDSSALYSNPNLNELYLGNNTLLRTLDVRNCPNLTMSVDLKGCTNIEEAYFDGTSITGLELPNGGILKKLHLPNTITDLTLLNQTALTEFVCSSFDNVTTLRIENIDESVVDTFEIFSDMPANSRIRLLGVNWKFDDVEDIFDVLDKLDTMRGLDENGNNVPGAQFSGTFDFEGTISYANIQAIKARYPNINVTYDHITTAVTFVDENNNVLDTQIITDGGNAVEPVAAGRITAPGKDSTQLHSYTFNGWNGSLNAVTTDRTVMALFTEHNLYYLRFYNYDNTLLHTQVITDIGDGIEPIQVPTKEADLTYTYSFNKWVDSEGNDVILSNISSDMNVYADFSANYINYTITFDTDGGNTISAITGHYGDTVIAPSNPTKTGHTFSGWSREIPNTIPAENAVITALWQINQYTITFLNYGNNIYSQSILDYGTPISIPSGVPIIVGEEEESFSNTSFLGWIDSDNTSGGFVNSGIIGNCACDKTFIAKFSGTATIKLWANTLYSQYTNQADEPYSGSPNDYITGNQDVYVTDGNESTAYTKALGYNGSFVVYLGGFDFDRLGDNAVISSITATGLFLKRYYYTADNDEKVPYALSFRRFQQGDYGWNDGTVISSQSVSNDIISLNDHWKLYTSIKDLTSYVPSLDISYLKSHTSGDIVIRSYWGSVKSQNTNSVTIGHIGSYLLVTFSGDFC